MAYIGLSPVTNFLSTFSQKFSGDNSTLQFILTRAVSRAEDLEVFVGNTQVLPGAYTAVGNELTFVSAPTAGTDNITVIFRAGSLQTVEIGSTGFPAGSAASPGVFYSDGSNTGLYWPSVSSVAISALGVKRVEVSSATNATSTTTGALQVAGGLSATGNLFAGGIVRFTNETESDGVSSGALVVSGGVGIAKNLNVNGDIQVTGDFTVAGTFTTTASDSLAINDPFLFLATNNTGDSLDTGFASKYVDGALVDRYSGFFRDVTDGVYKVFANLTVEPSTAVNTTDPSFSLADFAAKNISSSGIIQAISGAEASSTTTGALQVTGGVGVTGAIYAASLDLGSGNIATTGFLSNVAGINASGVVRTTGILYANSNIATTSTTTGALVVNGGVGVTGNITAGNVSATNLTGTILTASQPNITSVGTLGSLNVTGNIGASSVNATNLTGTILTAAQTTITSVGTLSSLNVNGSITVNTANNATAIANGGTAGSGNIGGSGAGFNTAFVKATSAQYADVAERYLADADYEPGTVLHFGGDYEVSQCNADACTRVAGVVSTNPAYIMNDSLVGDHVVELALLGRVPCKVEGAVQRGDMMVSAGNGRARAEANPKLGTVIGKALENFTGDVGVIEVVVGRN
jgi:hypothetical protein